MRIISILAWDETTLGKTQYSLNNDWLLLSQVKSISLKKTFSILTMFFV